MGAKFSLRLPESLWCQGSFGSPRCRSVSSTSEPLTPKTSARISHNHPKRYPLLFKPEHASKVYRDELSMDSLKGTKPLADIFSRCFFLLSLSDGIVENRRSDLSVTISLLSCEISIRIACLCSSIASLMFFYAAVASCVRNAFEGLFELRRRRKIMPIRQLTTL